MLNILLFLILFGILVFIHEFGHFIIAKRVGIGVDKFFLGWGPKMFSIKRGETEYGINWIPIGGYVKLVGDEVGEETSMQENSFMAKSPGKRIAVVSAGPVMNLLLPIVLFAGLYFIGVPALGPYVGDVIKGSPAEIGGLRDGDKILKVDNTEVSKWEELTDIIRKSEGRNLFFEVDRKGQRIGLDIQPEKSRVENIFKETVDGYTVGITPYMDEPVIGIADKSSQAYKLGLRNGDIVRRIAEKKIDYYWEFEEFLEDTWLKKIEIEIERGDKIKKRKTFTFKWDPQNQSVTNDLGILPAELFIASVEAKSIAAQRGLKPGDLIVSIDKVKTRSWLDLEKKISQNKGDSLNIEILRDNKFINISITPEISKEKETLTGASVERRRLGITSLMISKNPPVIQISEQTYNPFKAVYLGLDKTWLILKTQVIGFVKLVQGKLSVKHIGGPVMIYKFAGGSFRVGGLFSFISAIALLSIVLGFINLLPIPILDGGHIFFYLIEIIARRPLSIKAREVAQYFGLAMIFALLALATYNDVKRYFWEGIVDLFKRIF